MRQPFTPTAASASIAGFGFWILIWSIVLKLDTITKLFGLRTRLKYRIQDWVRANKGLSLCLTEVLNFSIHGIRSAEGVTFALGGTLFNILYVLFINPVLCWRRRTDYTSPMVFSVKKGTAA